MWDYPFRMMRFGRGEVCHFICARIWLVVTLGYFLKHMHSSSGPAFLNPGGKPRLDAEVSYVAEVVTPTRGSGQAVDKLVATRWKSSRWSRVAVCFNSRPGARGQGASIRGRADVSEIPISTWALPTINSCSH
jgi:hypothetical protein